MVQRLLFKNIKGFKNQHFVYVYLSHWHVCAHMLIEIKMTIIVCCQEPQQAKLSNEVLVKTVQ